MRRPKLHVNIVEPSPAVLRGLWAMGHGCIGGLVLMYVINMLLLDRSSLEFTQLISMHAVSGHVGNMTIGVKHKYPGWFLITQSCLQDFAQMFYVYPLYVQYGYRRLVRMKVIGPWIKNTHETAMAHHKSVAPYGALGLFMFVVLPGPSTGPVIGSLLGYTLGIGTFITFMSCGLGIAIMGVGWYYGVDKAAGLNDEVLPILLAGILVFFIGGAIAALARFAWSVRKKGMKVFDAELSASDIADEEEADEETVATVETPESLRAAAIPQPVAEASPSAQGPGSPRP